MEPDRDPPADDAAPDVPTPEEPARPSEPFDLASFAMRALPIAILAVAGISVPVMIFQPSGLPRMHALDDELRTVRDENKASEREIADLRVEVQGLRDDPASVERIARDQLGMVRKSEIVFQFPKKSQDP